MPRHRHSQAYAAVVLAGGYIEAGDHGRIRVQPGSVVVHVAHEAHQDHFATTGASILNIPLQDGIDATIGRVRDPDAIARLSQHDIASAAALLKETIEPQDLQLADWPDRLAAALASKHDFSIEDWAADMGLAPPSISRGFRQVYGVSPKRYRFEQRTLQTIRQLRTWTGSLADLAAAAGFADQSHLCRAVVALTGVAPKHLQVKSVQDRCRACQ
ncbi:MAG: AraC family transcriptional regulator [Pseudomonadota bacterium]|nr:AraC family transcriptional regulator [Pseudomonadota bacterium]